MSNKKKGPKGPEERPFLLPQPVEGQPLDAIQMVDRYGTYEIQPTTDSENFFPSIGAGEFNGDTLHRLRRQTEIGADSKD